MMTLFQGVGILLAAGGIALLWGAARLHPRAGSAGLTYLGALALLLAILCLLGLVEK